MFDAENHEDEPCGQCGKSPSVHQGHGSYICKPCFDAMWCPKCTYRLDKSHVCVPPEESRIRRQNFDDFMRDVDGTESFAATCERLRRDLATEVARREQAERERDEALRDMGHMLDKREELEEELKLSRRAFGDLHQHLVDRKEGAEAALFAMAQKAELAIMITDGIVYLPATGRMTTREVLKLEADVARLTAAHREVREKLEAAESRIKIERKIRKGAIGAYCALREKAWALLNASKAHLSDDDALDTWNRCADACSELDAALAAKPEGGERHGQD